jgi:ring-1,2-phenylacetyl-CoA epoxidase subunit PaaE
VAVKRLDGGVFSTWVLDGLRPGDELEVLPPAGRFGPPVEPSRALTYGLIAAGSGITPVLSIAWTCWTSSREPGRARLRQPHQRRRDVPRGAGRPQGPLPDRLQVLHVLSREEQESELLTGRIDRDRLQRLFATLLPVRDVDEWYLCGPFGMVTDGRETLLAAGVDPSQVHVELFHADAPPPRVRTVTAGSPELATVTVVLHGRTTTLPVHKTGHAVLDAVLAVRADAPYACKGGVCGTCRARCVSGRVEMDVNYALEPDELAAGVVLTCQSHPTTDEVRLEFL